jgi:hypothetical protein
MALPTVVKTWRCQHNATITGANAGVACQNISFAILTALLGGGSWTDLTGAAASAPVAPWVIVSSSNGIAAGNNDNVNRIASAADFSPGPVAVSWYVAHNATLGMWLCYRHGGGGSNHWEAEIRVSKVGFGAAFGGVNGTTAAQPTATDQQTLLGTAYWGGPDTNGEGTDLHIQMAHDGTTRIWLTRNVCVGAWLFERLDATGNWLYPIAAFAEGDKDATEIITTARLGISSTGASEWRGWRNDGATITLSMVNFDNPSFTDHIFDALTTANPFSARYPLFGVPVYSSNAGAVGVHGHFQDLWLGLNAVTTGDCYDDDAVAVRHFIHFDKLVTVWNTSTPLLNPNGAEPARTIRPAELIGASIGTPASDPPTVTNFVPALGNPLAASDTVQFDVLGADHFVLLAGYGEGPAEPVAVDVEGVFRFCSPWTGAREALGDDWRYRVRRTGGLPKGKRPRFYAVAMAGGEVSS